MFCCFLCCCKRKASKVCMNIHSTLLFLSGAFTIYVSICLFFNIQLLGGVLRTEEEKQDDSKIYFNSYIHMFIFVSGILALIMSLLGCCTSRVSEKCCVCCFTTVLLGFFVVAAVFAMIMIAINL